jgi:hypothetical protein
MNRMRGRVPKFVKGDVRRDALSGARSRIFANAIVNTVWRNVPAEIIQVEGSAGTRSTGAGSCPHKAES